MPLKSAAIVIFKFNVVQKHTSGEAENLYNTYVKNFLRKLTVKEFCK